MYGVPSYVSNASYIAQVWEEADIKRNFYVSRDASVAAQAAS